MKCQFLAEYTDDFLQSNAFRTEVIQPYKYRCMLRQPERMKKFDPTGTRWLLSGGSALHFKECDCKNTEMCARKIKEEQA